MVAIKVVGYFFSFKVPVKTTTKGILKNDMKGLQIKGKNLNFDPTCVSTKTKVDHFLTGMVLRQLFAKSQCFSR